MINLYSLKDFDQNQFININIKNSELGNNLNFKNESTLKISNEELENMFDEADDLLIN
jgi:sulfate adenylyltransferase subunit 1 (EFTu-like GTPase family)